MILLAGQSHPGLGAQLAKVMRAELGTVEFRQFANGEKRVQILTSLMNQPVVIVQSFSQPVDENIIELMLLIDAAERAGASDITVVIPWLGYSLQDKMFLPGMPISARVVADMISHQFVQRVLLVDLHNLSIAGFFSVPTRILTTQQMFADYVEENWSDVVVISPDFGGLKRAREFAELLGAPLANIEKSRDRETGEVTMHSIAGADINGKICIIYDDIINTGSTLIKGAEFLKQNGAKEVHMLATHGLFVEDALARLQDSQVDSVVVTDSVEHDLPEKVQVLSLASLISAELHALLSHTPPAK